MKKYFFGILTIILAVEASAATMDATGYIGDVRYHIDNGQLAPNWNKTTWFQLTNVVGQTCSQSKVSIPPGNETAISILLAAKMANKQVKVTVDDTALYPAGSYCSLQYITIIE